MNTKISCIVAFVAFLAAQAAFALPDCQSGQSLQISLSADFDTQGQLKWWVYVEPDASNRNYADQGTRRESVQTLHIDLTGAAPASRVDLFAIALSVSTQDYQGGSFGPNDLVCSRSGSPCVVFWKSYATDASGALQANLTIAQGGRTTLKDAGINVANGTTVFFARVSNDGSGQACKLQLAGPLDLIPSS